jgi:hypothetical protein
MNRIARYTISGPTMTSDAWTNIGIFLEAQTIAGVAGFFTMRADVKNLKGWVKAIAQDTKATAMHVASLPCRNCKQQEERG